MHQIAEFIHTHSTYAPWLVFGSILLAGLNIPVSIDIIMILSAVLAATTIPEHTVSLYFSLLFGCYFSAWIAYWIGRTWGKRLLRTKWFGKVLPEKRLEKVGRFYEKHGLWTLLIGRFIPFGVRNCLFMTTGMSKLSFRKFIVRDALACFVWTSLTFYLFFTLGVNYEALVHHVKIINVCIFSAFSVTLIGILWYKKMGKKKQAKRVEQNPDKQP